MIVSQIEIERFRMIEQQSFELGEDLTAIIGQNGTMKSTLLGMIGEPFRFETPFDNGDQYKTIDNRFFQIPFSEAFKFSDGPEGLERAGEHVWFAEINEDIYPNKKYRAFTAPRGSIKNNKIRTWAGTSKASGEKHAQAPVIYLSLKRLIPIGEEKRVHHDPIELSPEESDFFEEYHRKILLLEHKMSQAEFVTSTNKSTLGFATKEYDSLTNSAGQDNIGKILLSVLSFKRLKEALGAKYKGGLLLIDEIDATLYPAAQVQLIKALFRFAHDVNLQIVFTTHSPDIVQVLNDQKLSSTSKIIYLETRDKKTRIFENLPQRRILAHLRAETVKPENTKKIQVFSEDSSTRIFLKGLLEPTLKRQLKFIDIDFSEGMLNSLRKAKLPDFVEGIIVYDGDIDSDKPTYKSPNSLSLPGNAAPERVFFRYLQSLPETDAFWDKTPGGYLKQTCFRDFTDKDEKDDNKVKRWFNREKQHFGRGCLKLIKRYIEDHIDEVEAFRKAFNEAFSAVGGKLE